MHQLKLKILIRQLHHRIRWSLLELAFWRRQRRRLRSNLRRLRYNLYPKWKFLYHERFTSSQNPWVLNRNWRNQNSSKIQNPKLRTSQSQLTKVNFQRSQNWLFWIKPRRCWRRWTLLRRPEIPANRWAPQKLPTPALKTNIWMAWCPKYLRWHLMSKKNKVKIITKIKIWHYQNKAKVPKIKIRKIKTIWAFWKINIFQTSKRRRQRRRMIKNKLPRIWTPPCLLHQPA